jgi:hypothetical protein
MKAEDCYCYYRHYLLLLESDHENPDLKLRDTRIVWGSVLRTIAARIGTRSNGLNL